MKLHADLGQSRVVKLMKDVMRNGSLMLTAIEFAFVVAIIASVSVLGIAGLLFGFQIEQWNEWQGVVGGMAVTTSAIIGAKFGARLALRPKR